MIFDLQEKEHQIATDLIKDGLDHASVTLSSILKTPIAIKKIDFGFDSLQQVESVRPTDDASSSYYLLRTGLIGELKGVCHLIFTAEEIEKINAACLPEHFQKSASVEAAALSEGFLTELDNIVSAAVITQFSNYLDVDLFGHVPSLHIMPAGELKDYLQSEAEEFNNVVYFKANFVGEELDITPDFTWMFQDQFLNKIRERSAEGA
ncbi:hypothetical protein SAMN04488028_105227 [Reichenbachiella agariperforans]|uniref:Chemotaxis protein CheC n=1 Tax=Reichenbachiella agariperforans TaxID=156994 RepID=A0A1M6T0H1_REIAG|nr:hypothetical protein [Reichenbachiella agariperforans]SHK50288.1 hypothetical protein SAMN04488028_105227 [Reichenbachiella agariperforans]